LSDWCLIPEKADEFIGKLKNGEINPEKMASMSSEERHSFLGGIVGSNHAEQVNFLFESKLLLKNQQKGMIDWAKKVSGLNQAKQKDLITKIQGLEKVLTPEDEKAFMSDLVHTKLGVDVNAEEAKTIVQYSKEASDLLTKSFNADNLKWATKSDKLDYGMAKVNLEKYVNDMSGGNKSIKQSLKERGQEFSATWKESKSLAGARLGKDVLKTANETTISLMASIDNSFLGRQGLKTLQIKPSVWVKGAKESFKDIAKTFGGKKAKDVLMADIYSRPKYISGEYQTAGIFPKTEEQFPTSLPDKLPSLLGKTFKASEVAFEGSAIRMRAGLYDFYSDIARRNGQTMNKYQIESIGKLVNSLTARGKWGSREEPAIVRTLLWAPRMIKANIDVLTAHTGQDISKFAKKEARKNLLKIVAETSAVLATANALKPGSVEWDPRSSDFGKIKSGNTRFDVTGGASSLITLASRILTLSSKSSTTGKVSQLNTGEYGARTALDVIYAFMEGKSAPGASIAIDLLKGETFEGQKPTLGSELPIPIAVKNFLELRHGYSTDALVGAMLDTVGINASTYGSTRKDVEKITGEGINPAVIVEFDRLREKGYAPTIADIDNAQSVKSIKEKSEDKYNAFMKEFQNQYSKKLEQTISSEKYRSETIDKKEKMLDKIRNDLRESLAKKYGYKKTKKKKEKIDEY